MYFLLYPIIKMLVTAAVLTVALLMILRLIANYTDPNPFGALGRFNYRLKKFTDSFVQPATVLLMQLRLDARFAPLLTLLIFCVFGYFTLEFSALLLQTVDGITASLSNGSIARLLGYLLVGALGFMSLAIIIRVIFSWIMGANNRFMRFLMRITDPLLIPFRRIIPPIGAFDFSPMILIFLIQFLQRAVAAVLLS